VEGGKQGTRRRRIGIWVSKPVVLPFPNAGIEAYREGIREKFGKTFQEKERAQGWTDVSRREKNRILIALRTEKGKRGGQDGRGTIDCSY